MSKNNFIKAKSGNDVVFINLDNVTFIEKENGKNGFSVYFVTHQRSAVFVTDFYQQSGTDIIGQMANRHPN
jgi:thiamine phosphate synthase YjbQ (UPF0047 family)